MSKTTIVCSALGLALVACATGGQNGSGEQADAAMSTGKHDAAVQSFLDAPRPATDAGTTPPGDAQVSQMPDAGSSGPFCTMNNQCTVAGECCQTFGGQFPTGFCTPGTIVFGVCTPFT
jgi:hypothetical protein